MLVRDAKINADSNTDGEYFESVRKIRQAQWIKANEWQCQLSTKRTKVHGVQTFQRNSV